MQQSGATTHHRKKPSAGRVIAVVFVLLFSLVVGTVVGICVHYPDRVSALYHQITAQSSSSAADGSAADASDPAEASDKAAGDTTQLNADTPTRQVAAYDGVKIYSPIAQSDLTGVLFHQASYNTAVVMTTKLPDADLEKVSQEHPVRVNHKQTDGDWVDADALHLYRVQDATLMDTSIDMGAKAGTMVYAPVTGTVVLVEKYDLYGYVPDVKIHIQPEGRPDLDVVLLHQYDPEVKAGDWVEGGVSPLSHVRDIAKDLTDVQLGFYTAPEDPGNHSHVQVNNADSEYRKTTLKNAYKVKE